ncbi:MAG: hypothetical protein AAFY75_07755 [Pseudomonadota bacterium]
MAAQCRFDFAAAKHKEFVAFPRFCRSAALKTGSPRTWQLSSAGGFQEAAMLQGFSNERPPRVHMLRSFVAVRQIRDDEQPDLCVCAAPRVLCATDGEKMALRGAPGSKSPFEIKDSLQFARRVPNASQCPVFKR